MATSGTLTFTPGGPLRQTVPVAVRDDLTNESPEAFELALSNPTNVLLTNSTADGRIRDDDLPPVRVQGASVTEGPSAKASFKVTLAGAAAVPVVVNFTTGPTPEPNGALAGGDYTTKAGSLTFAPGVTSQTVAVDILDDTIWEADAEAFLLTATNAANGQADAATGTILENERASRARRSEA